MNRQKQLHYLLGSYGPLQSDTQFCYHVADIKVHKITWTKQDGNIIIDDILSPHGSNCGGFAVNKHIYLLKNLSKLILKIKCAV